MSRKFLTSLDLNKNELQNARVQNLGSAPSTPVTGQLYYNSGDNTLYWWNNTSWVAAKDAGATSVFYQTIRDGGTARTQRNSINFVDSAGNTITVTDDAGGDESEITVDTVFAAVTAQTTFGAASGNGSAVTSARSDHTHGTPTHDDTAHSGIHLNALATATGNYNMGGFNLTNIVATPSAATDAASKGYVDSIAAGINDFKNSVRVATTANGTLATAFANGQTVDGVTLATGDRILIKSQSTASENGIYTVNSAGAPTRATDADATGELSVGSLVYVELGTTNGAQQWIVSSTTATPWVPNSSGSTWTLYFAVTSAQAGAGLTATGNVLAVGAGTGITVAADTVALDTAVATRKYVIAPFGGSTSQAVTHNLNTDVPLVAVYEVATNAQIECDVTVTSVNGLTLGFAVAPGAASLRGVVVG